MALTSYLDGCDESPTFSSCLESRVQVTFPAHTAKFKALPDGSVLRGYDGMASGEAVSLPSDVTADGFCNLLCNLYGKDMALMQDNWHCTFVSYARLTMMETEFEAQLLDFAKH